MVACCVVECGNRSLPKSKQNNNYISNRISFHRFPEDLALRQAWIDAVRRENWNPTKTSVVCSAHFEKNYVEESPFYRKLQKTAVPTIFPTCYNVKRLNVNHTQIVPASPMVETSTSKKEGNMPIDLSCSSTKSAAQPPALKHLVIKTTPLSLDRKSRPLLLTKTTIIENYEFKLNAYRKKIKIMQQRTRRHVRRLDKYRVVLSELKKNK